MAHELAPPSYDVVVGADKRRSDNTYELRSISDPFGRVKRPPHYTRSQSTQERTRPYRNKRLQDSIIDEDEVFEKPFYPEQTTSLGRDQRRNQLERTKSLDNQNARARRQGRLDDAEQRQSSEDLRRTNRRLQKSFEDLRRIDQHQRQSLEDLRRSRSPANVPSTSRTRTYSAGYESLRPPSAVARQSSTGELSFSPRNTFYGNLGPPTLTFESDSRAGTPKSSSGDSQYSLNGHSSNRTRLKSASSESGQSSGRNTNTDAPFHPYLSDDWQAQTGHPSSLDQDVSDTQTEGYSSYASTLEKDLKPDRSSVNNKSKYDEARQGSWGITNGSAGKAYYKEKPAISEKPVNFVKPSIPVKPQVAIKPQMATGGASSPISKGAYHIENIPPLPEKGTADECVFNFDPIKILHHQHSVDREPLNVYAQYQATDPSKSRRSKPQDGVIFDPSMLRLQLSEAGSEPEQSGTLKSNATQASNASRSTNRSLDHYRQDYRSLSQLRAAAETQSTASSDDSAGKTTTDSALETAEAIALRNHQKRLQRSRYKRLGCGLFQIVVGVLLIGTAVVIFLHRSQGWFTCAGFWGGTFAAIGGSLGILTHYHPKDKYVKIMIGACMFNICVVYLAVFCIGLSFGLVQMEEGVKEFVDAMNFVYAGLSLLGVVASAFQMSPVEHERELKELEIAKYFVDWKRLQVKPPSPLRTSSTSSSQDSGSRDSGGHDSGGHASAIGGHASGSHHSSGPDSVGPDSGGHGSGHGSGSLDQDGYRNYGYESPSWADTITSV